MEATVSNGKRIALVAEVIDEQGHPAGRWTLRPSGGIHRASLGPLQPGGYHVVIGGTGSMTTSVAPVTCTVLVWG